MKSSCLFFLILSFPICLLADNTEFVETCDSYTDPTGTVYTTSGIYSYIVPDMQGMDSTVIFELVINPSYEIWLFEEICASGEFTQDTLMQLDFTSVKGCDSTVWIELQIAPISESYFYESACEVYTTPDGYSYTESGYYTNIFTDQSGCDSIVHLVLEVISIQNTISILGNTLIADESDAVYQWVDCDNDFEPIEGAMSQVFVPESLGNYAVFIEKDNCTKLSNCVFFENLINEENDKFANAISVFPNPTDGSVQVSTGTETDNNSLICIYDVFGKVIEIIELSPGSHNTELFINGPKGIYFIELEGKNEDKKIVRVLKH